VLPAPGQVRLQILPVGPQRVTAVAGKEREQRTPGDLVHIVHCGSMSMVGRSPTHGAKPTSTAPRVAGEAQRIDDAEDAQFGRDRRGDELPAELARRDGRLAKLREARMALEAQAAEAAAEHAAELARRKHDEPAPPPPRGRIPKTATAKQRMARKLTTKPARAAYARRKAISSRSSGR
jgi:hypothetical protein